MNMNICKTLKHSALYLSLIAIIGGCDVTDDEIDGEGSTSQEGDAVVVDFPIAYIQRPVPVGLLDDDDTVMNILPENILEPSESRAGAVLVLKDRASVSAGSRIITEGIFPGIPGETPDDPTTEPLYDVRDLSANTDGSKLVFSMRAPLDENLDDDDPDQPTWNIWEYDLLNDTLTRVIESNILAAKGHDRFPIYLSNDDIVFSSSRQQNSRAMMPNLNRPQYTYVTEAEDDSRAFTLHRIDETRTEITQISYGKGHDIQPTLLNDGHILFLRGDDTSGRNGNRLSLYRMNPDGSDVSLYYGYHSDSGTSPDENSGALTKPIQMQDDRILVTFKPRETSLFGGDIYSVDGENYIDLTAPVASNLGATGPAETSLSVAEVILEAQSPHGYFNSAYPMYDGTNRLLVSWMPCLVQGYRINTYVQTVGTTDEDDDTPVQYFLIDVDGNYVDRDGDVIPAETDDSVAPPVPLPIVPVEITAEEITSLPCSSDTFENPEITPSEPQFGIWVYDLDSQTQDPVVIANELGTIYTEAIVLGSKPSSIFVADEIDDPTLRSELRDENLGVIHIRSVYDLDGVDTTPNGIIAMADPVATSPDTRPVRFVRFIEEANQPHEDDYNIDDNIVGGRTNNPGRSIVGYAQVHPDGSVKTKVPANTALSMEFLDINGRRVGGALGQRHRNWINVVPGEVRECNGCHTAASTSPHGRRDAEAESVNPGNINGLPFSNTLLTNHIGSPFANSSPPVSPNVGETMAEYFVRAKRSVSGEYDPLALSLDLQDIDDWTDPAVDGAVPSEPICVNYIDLPQPADPDDLIELESPVRLAKCSELVDANSDLISPQDGCFTQWEADCRIVIDYPDHIQPIFELTRVGIDPENGEQIDTTCINCHSTADPDGLVQVPAPGGDTPYQLDFMPYVSLKADQANNEFYFQSYDEFLFNGDDREELEVLNADGTDLEDKTALVFDANGVQQFQMTNLLDINGIETFEFLDLAGDTQCVSQADGDANPDFTQALNFDIDPAGVAINCLRFLCTSDDDSMEIFDIDGNCVEREPVIETLLQERYFSPNGANNGTNQKFFNAFGEGGAHANWLTPAEIKLFSEWLDMGGQYYNEIFKALDD